MLGGVYKILNWVTNEFISSSDKLFFKNNQVKTSHKMLKLQINVLETVKNQLKNNQMKMTWSMMMEVQNWWKCF